MSLSSVTNAIQPLADAAFLGTQAMNGYFEKQELKEKQKQGLEALHKKLEDKKVAQSFDCMEGLPQKTETSQKQEATKQINFIRTEAKTRELAPVDELRENQVLRQNFIRDEIPKYGFTVASIMHVLASMSKAFKFLPQPLADFLHVNSTRLSKAFNFVNYTVKGADALKHNRSWDALGRLAYSAIVPFQDQEDLFLSSGISSGITMFEQGQRHKVLNPDKPKNLIENFGHNFSAFTKMIPEIIQGGLGKNRKIFVHENNEKGHTMFLGALGNFSGALLGILSGKGKSTMKKIATIIRNVGGIVCDWGKIVSPDWNNKISGFTYLAVSMLDVAQSLAPEPLASTISHLSLAINNVANYFYVNTSKATSDGTFQDFRGNNKDQFSVNLAKTSPDIRETIKRSTASTAA